MRSAMEQPEQLREIYQRNTSNLSFLARPAPARPQSARTPRTGVEAFLGEGVNHIYTCICDGIACHGSGAASHFCSLPK